MLLHTVKGPTSFDDLCTVEGNLCVPFREACQRMGLLEDEKHWKIRWNKQLPSILHHD